jgi:hypothetical protein
MDIVKAGGKAVEHRRPREKTEVEIALEWKKGLEEAHAGLSRAGFKSVTEPMGGSFTMSYEGVMFDVVIRESARFVRITSRPPQTDEEKKQGYGVKKDQLLTGTKYILTVTAAGKTTHFPTIMPLHLDHPNPMMEVVKAVASEFNRLMPTIPQLGKCVALSEEWLLPMMKGAAPEALKDSTAIDV